MVNYVHNNNDNDDNNNNNINQNHDLAIDEMNRENNHNNDVDDDEANQMDIDNIHQNWERLQQQQRLLEDLDSWLETNGLRDSESSNVSSNENEKDEHQRIVNEHQYIKSIHDKIFQNEIQQERYERIQKKRFVSNLCGQTMSISTLSDNNNNSNNSTEIIDNIPIDRMVNVCDTIYRMVQHQQTFQVPAEEQDLNFGNTINNSDTTNSTRNNHYATVLLRTSLLSNNISSSSFHLSLESYTKSSVLQFINLCRIVHEFDISQGCIKVEDYNHSVKEKEDQKVDDSSTCVEKKKKQAETSTLRSSNCDGHDMDVSSILVQAIQKITDDNIVLDCCRIGHYVMAQSIVDAITDVLVQSIDTNNCYVLYQFATQYNLSTTLIERTLYHMMDTIGEYCTSKSRSDDNNSDEDDELQERLMVMKRAMETSLHSGVGSRNASDGGKRRLYFTSIDEYLAIFAERVQYYQERLIQAKENIQQQLIENEKYSQSYTKRNILSSSQLDMEKKIKKQEERVRTLQIAYREQKELFRSKNNSNDS